MNAMTGVLMFLPEEFLVLIIAAAGIAMIVGARAFAGTLIGLAGAIIVLPVLLAPLFDALPSWLLYLLLAYFGLGLAIAVLTLPLRGLIGRNATEHTVGILAADVIRGLLIGPFRLLGRIVRALIGRP